MCAYAQQSTGDVVVVKWSDLKTWAAKTPEAELDRSTLSLTLSTSLSLPNPPHHHPRPSLFLSLAYTHTHTHTQAYVRKCTIILIFHILALESVASHGLQNKFSQPE